MHIGQGQKVPNPHCHTDINITPTPTSLSAMRKMLSQGWNPQDQVTSSISIEERTDSMLSSQSKDQYLFSYSLYIYEGEAVSEL